MISRATDATFINEVVNHPSVRPFVHAKPGRLDLSAVVANPNNFVLTGRHGGMIFVELVPGLVEIHTQVLPDGRGPWALMMAQQCVEWLFTRTRATEVFTRVPQGNVAAMALARACGAKPEQRLTQDLNGEQTEIEIYGGRIQDWIRTAPGLVQRGIEFHDRLHAKCAAIDLKVNHHAQDDWHDRHVGAAASMILGGQPVKGVLFFNRWAAMAMAPPIRVVSNNPLVLDITDCRLEIQGEDFEVLPCPQA